MVCIYCSGNTQVTNSRHHKRTNQVWRRRKCLACGALFSTHEHADLTASLSLRRLARIEPFSRDILFLSIYECLKHRSSAPQDATALTQTVVSKLPTRIVAASIERDSLVEIVNEVLGHFDTAAVTFYRAYHPDNR